MTANIETLLAKAFCESEIFNDCNGRCAAICLDQLGDARSKPHGCSHAERVFLTKARLVLDKMPALTIENEQNKTELENLPKLLRACNIRKITPDQLAREVRLEMLEMDFEQQIDDMLNAMDPFYDPDDDWDY